MFERLVKQMAERKGVTEQLKAANSMEWARKMNGIRNEAVEITVISTAISDFRMGLLH